MSIFLYMRSRKEFRNQMKEIPKISSEQPFFNKDMLSTDWPVCCPPLGSHDALH